MNDIAAMGPLENRRDDAPGVAVDDQNPWLGLDSFTEETRGYFYGREDEIAELARRVQRKSLTILFGQSGLGKTSILRAGIVPRLRPEGFCPIYVRIAYGADTPPPAEQIKDAIARATTAAGQWTRVGVAVEGESLWEFLHHRDDTLLDAQGKPLIPLLIFDQFEEIFTLSQIDDLGRRRAAEFVEDLANLVENRPPKALEARMEEDDTAGERFDFARNDYRVLISLREDYLAHLESFKPVMPSITQNRMRLARMTGAQALAAVVKPGGKLVSLEVAESIVRFIAGGSELANAEVEPSLLSLICRELNNARIAQGRAEISADLLAGSHATILSEFYERALRDQPPGVHRVIEDQLLTEAGFRESLAEERVLKAFAAAGAAPDALAALVNRRLLRIEERLDVRRVELTHDVLCGVVRAARELRQEREARDDAERKLAAQRERERQTRAALQRARRIAFGCALLSVVAVASAIYGYISSNRARETRSMAEGARSEAERLVGYLLDDFYDQLAPVGRLDVVAELAKRALGYYDGLPPELRSPATTRNRALALVRYASALTAQAKLDEAGKAIDDAVSSLEKLHRDGDSSEATVLGLAQALSGHARIETSRAHFDEARAPAEQAVALIKPLATSSGADPAVQRAYCWALTGLGYAQLRSGQPEQAVPTFNAARVAIAPLDASTLDIPAASCDVDASTWLSEAYARSNQLPEARDTTRQGLALADRVLAQQPIDLPVMRRRAVMISFLAADASYTLHLARALEFDDSQIRAWDELLRIDSTSNASWNNRGIAFLSRAGALWKLGRFREAIDAGREAGDVGRHTPEDAFLAQNLMGATWAMLEGVIQIDDRPLLLKLQQQLHAHTEIFLKSQPEASVPRQGLAVFLDWIDLRIAEATGQPVDFLKQSAALIGRAEKTVPKSDNDLANHVSTLLALYQEDAEHAYTAGDYARVGEDARKALSIGESHFKNDVEDDSYRRDVFMTLRALALAHLGQRDEALPLAQSALADERNLLSQGADDQFLRVETARTLLAVALAKHDATSAADLKEAQGLMNHLPVTIQTSRDAARWRGRIEDEINGRH